MLVDGFGDRGRLGRLRRSIVGSHSLRGERRPGQSDPELGTGQPAGGCRVVLFLQEFEALVRDGVEPDVVPRAELFWRSQAERIAGALGIDRERAEHIGDFGDAETTMKRHRPEMMAMQATGELREDGIFRVGGNAFDHELLPRDPQREERSLLEQMFGAPRHARCRGGKRRVTLRIHRVLMEGDRELDQKIGQLPGEGGCHGLP